MASVQWVHPNEQMAYSLSALRAYGRRVSVENEALAEDEERNKANLIHSCIRLATWYKCTEKEVVSLIFKGFFK